MRRYVELSRYIEIGFFDKSHRIGDKENMGHFSIIYIFLLSVSCCTFVRDVSVVDKATS